MKLAEIDTFGGLDADTDKLLDSCFEDHEAYISALNHQAFLILGRKGSGKTAIFRKLITARQPDIFAIGHTFTDYPWHHHDKQEAVGVPEEERFVHSWKYLVLLTVSKVLLNYDQSQPWSLDVLDSLSKLEKFVVDSYGTRDPDVTQIFSPQKKLQFHSSFEIPLTSLKLSIETKTVPIENLPTIIQEVNENLSQAVIASLNPAHNYYVCFDQLDIGFDPTDSKYRNRLVGLLLAARDINVRAKQQNKRLSVIVFLRDDIYETLRFEDKNKLTESFMSRVAWDAPKTKRTLKQLMEKRFAAVLGVPEAGAWDAVFDETELMTGRQSKYHHITDRTFLRPRDTIKFCNEILNAYKNRSETSARPAVTRSLIFDNRDIQGARDEYSSYFLHELDDEIFKHVPGYQNYVEVLKTLDSMRFTLSDFVGALNKRKQILPKDIYPTAILKILFEFSIISYYSPGGSGYGGAQYVWKYQDPRAQFNEAATSFRIHPALKESLALKKFSRL